MKQQTAVEWLQELYNSRPAYEEFIMEDEFEQAKEMEKEQMIGDMTRLLRWVLKHYNTGTDIDGFFMWENPVGEEFDSIDLVEQYYNETYNK